jgi:hypothetical protein
MRICKLQVPRYNHLLRLSRVHAILHTSDVPICDSLLVLIPLPALRYAVRWDDLRMRHPARRPCLPSHAMNFAYRLPVDMESTLKDFAPFFEVRSHRFSRFSQVAQQALKIMACMPSIAAPEDSAGFDQLAYQSGLVA